jgi:hypothetical protein
MRPRWAYYIHHTMRKTGCTTILVLVLVGSLGSAQSTPLLIDEATLAQLTAQGEVQSSLSDGAAPKLVPALPQRSELVATVQQAGLTTGVELLRLYEGKQDFSTPEAHLGIYNILRSISTMKGIQYYSVTRKKMRTLFAESYVVDNPQAQVPEADPVAESIPAESTLFVFQEDLTFGKILYQSRFRYEDGSFSVQTRNLTTMRYLLLPVVQPGRSLSILVVVPEGNRILFYGATGAHTLQFFGLERSREDSSYNRLQALYGWFTRRLEETF